MGGKQKQAQRTKGNVRPSSSARAAELLEASGTSGGFVGFGALSGDLGYVPATDTEADSSVDADLRMLLRKLSKRDATTKLKALQELTCLCKEKDVEAVKSMLPFWPRIYNKVSIDHERRVREASQQVLHQLCLRLRRDLAPHLRALMGTWLLAQCDPYAPCASEAKAAFEDAFPPSKQADALDYCKNEIFTQMQDNLLNHTAHTLSDSKTTEAEDMESKYLRVLSCSLSALTVLLPAVAKSHPDFIQDKYGGLLQQAKFWKLGKHTNVQIRSCFFLLLSGLCQHSLSLAGQYADKLCPVVLHNLDLTDPVIARSLWQAVLYVLTTVQDCWSHVNVRKGMYPKLWAVLKKGGEGSAAVIYPNLLPLLSRLPDEVKGQGLGFYEEFFCNMKTGLSSESVLRSPSECNAVIQAFVECVRYCLITYPQNDQLCDMLLQDQLLPVIAASIEDKSPIISNSQLYALLVDLLTLLHKLSTSPDTDSQKRTSAQKNLAVVYKSLEDMALGYLSREPSDCAKELPRLCSMLEAFTACCKISDGKKIAKGVKFADVDKTDQSAENAKSDLVGIKVNLKEQNSIADAKEVSSLISVCCCSTFRKCKDTVSVPHITFFSSVYGMYTSDRLMKELLALCEVDCHEEPSSSYLSLCVLDSIVMPWMNRGMEENSASDSLVSAYVEVMFATYRQGDAVTRCTALDKVIQQVTDGTVLNTFLRKVLEMDHEPATSRWFKGMTFGRRMVDITHALCEHSLAIEVEGQEDTEEQSASWALLSLAMSTDSNFEPVLGQDYMAEILSVIHQALPTSSHMTQSDSALLHRCVTFVCKVADHFFTNVKGCVVMPSSTELLAALFQLDCQPNSKLSDTVLECVRKCWQCGVVSLVQQQGAYMQQEEGFFHKAVSALRFSVVNDTNTLHRLEHLCSVSLSLAKCIVQGLGHKQNVSAHCDDEEEYSTAYTADLGICHPSVIQLFDSLSTPPMVNLIPEQWSVEIILSSDLSLPQLPSLVANVNSANIPKYVAPIAYKSQLYVAVTGGAALAEEQRKTFDKQTLSVCQDCAHAIAVCRSLLGKRREALHTSEVGKVCELLEKNFSTLVKFLRKKDYSMFLQAVIDRSLTEGGLWSKALEFVFQNGQENDREAHDWYRFVGSLDSFTCVSESSLHTLEVLLSYLPGSQVCGVAQLSCAMLLSLTPDTLTRNTGGVGHLSILTKALAQQETPVTPVCIGDPPAEGDLNHTEVLAVLAQIQAWRDQYEEVFLFSTDIMNEPWGVVSFNAAVARYLSCVVQHMPGSLSSEHWDFILCSLVAWIVSCNESRESIQSELKTQVFVCRVCELLAGVAHCMTVIVPESKDRFPDNLTTEWSEFFSEGAYSLVLPMFVQIAGSVPSELSAGECHLLTALSYCCSLCPAARLHDHKLPHHLVAGQDSPLPDSLQSLLNHLCPLLMCPHRPVQLAVYKMLLSIMSDLPKYDEGKSEEGDDQKEESSRSPPVAVLCVLEASCQALEVILQGTVVGETMIIDPYIVEHSLAMAYLLTWKLLLAVFRAASSEVRAEYAQHLKDMNAVDALLVHLFRLLPQSPLVTLKEGLTSSSPLQPFSATANMFGNQPLLNINDVPSSHELQHLTCAVYSTCLKDLPALLRQWWNNQDRNTSRVVEEYTSKYVSPILCAQEISAVQTTTLDVDNMTVRGRPVAREVVATYQVDEVTMELVIQLPSNHPLGTITVETGKRVGVASTQWRNWMLQLTTFLLHQNGSILDGLLLWKRNVDKRFEGVEDCMICFSVIHGTTAQLPKLQCRTCKKKFHSACLYKWFNTSNNSTCPLCRNLF